MSWGGFKNEKERTKMSERTHSKDSRKYQNEC